MSGLYPRTLCGAGRMSDFDVTGADSFLRLSKALKAAGQTGLRRELNKAVKAASKPAIKAVKDAAAAGLPQRGGAAAFIAGKRFRVATKTGKDPGVSVVMAKQDARLDTAGRLAHPVFGNRQRFAVTRVRPGILSDGFQSSVNEVRPEIEKALEAVAEQVIREAR